MSNSKLAPKRTDVSVRAAKADTLLGPPPLFKGEDRMAYQSLLDRVRHWIKPASIIEEFWVRDVVDLMWEALRLRRLKAQLMNTSAHKGVRKILEAILDTDPMGYRAKHLAEGWAAGDRAIAKEVDKLLAGACVDPEAITAQTLSIELDSIERIDRMLAGTEARRSMVLREIERHRDTLARRPRHSQSDVQDAEFEDVTVP